jgi:hypothetical protein
MLTLIVMDEFVSLTAEYLRNQPAIISSCALQPLSLLQFLLSLLFTGMAGLRMPMDYGCKTQMWSLTVMNMIHPYHQTDDNHALEITCLRK